MGFTFTAGATGFSGGKVVVIIPTVFPTPNTLGTNASRVRRVNIGTTSVSGIAVSGFAVTITVASMDPFGQFWVSYGDGAGPAPGGSGNFTFFTQAAPTGSPLLPIVNQPTVVVGLASATPTPTPSATPSPTPTRTPLAGDGTAAISPSPVLASATGQTMTLTYTAGTNAWINGQLILTIPGGWSSPDSVEEGVAGFFSVLLPDGGTFDNNPLASGQVITLNGINISAGARVVIVYGDKQYDPAEGAVVQSGTGTATFQVKTDPQPYSGSTPQPIASSPQVTVN
jgi:hypothetical protein